MNCPDCQGKGTITLLTSVSPCERCGGTGAATLKLVKPLKLVIDNPLNANLTECFKHLDAAAQEERVAASLDRIQKIITEIGGGRKVASQIDTPPAKTLPEPVERQAYRIREVAAELGVSKSLVRSWISEGRLIAVKIGGISLVMPEEMHRAKELRKKMVSSRGG